jgi:hypothetical protein
MKTLAEHLFEAIAHGDELHRTWLRGALEKSIDEFFKNNDAFYAARAISEGKDVEPK